MKADEVAKALRWIASNDEICFNAGQANAAADLLERLQAKHEAITKDRDQWRAVAEASRDVIQPKLRAEIAELKASQPVRCEECKYSSWASGNNSDECPMNLCRLKRIFGKEDVELNDYCSYGERRVEE